MGASIDERVVAMSFEQDKFQAGVAQTMAGLTKLNESLANIGKVNGLKDIDAAANKVTLTAPMTALDKLKLKLGLAGQGAAEGFGQIETASNKVSLTGASTALDRLRGKFNFPEAAQGFSEIERASAKVTLGPLNSAVDSVSAKFSAMTVIATSALSTLVMDATRQAAGLTKSLSLGPITQGFEEYATNLNSIQTILANTQASGAGLKDVNKALQELNAYSDQTIYNFSQMATSIGLFTAAGVDLETSTAAIKGIANLAALSGSNNEKATHAMQQLAQAISSGRVSLQDWNSVVNAGMGGTVFQRALATTAENMGTLSKGAVTLKGKMKNVSIEGQSFRESITARPGEKSWLTSEVLTSTLKQFTGDLSAAELKAQGFNDAQIKAILQTATSAKKAATEVKTIKGVFDVVKESIGSGWSATFQTIFGDFNEAKSTFTELSDTITGFVSKNADARNKVLKEWKELGGRKDLIEGIKNVFEALGSVLKPIKEAFRDIFPAKTGKDLAEMTKNFREFAENLKVSPQTAENLRRTFAGLFAVLSIGKTIVGNIIRVIFDLLGVVGQGSGGFLNFTGSIGDFLVSVDQAISKGDSLRGFFDGIAAVLRVPLEILGALASAFFSLFGGVDTKKADGVSASLDNVGTSLKPLEGLLDRVVVGWGKFVDILDHVKNAAQPMLGNIVAMVNNIGDAITNALKDLDFETLFSGLQTGLLAGIFVVLKKGIGGFDVTGGFIGNLNKLLTGLTGNLVAMQAKIRAEALLAIAGAVAVLAAGVFLLSKIDGEDMSRSMTAVAVGLGELMGAMKLMTLGMSKMSILQLPFIAASLVILAGAVVVLAAAMKIFSTISWEGLAKGLVGVGGSLAAVGLGTKLIGPEVLLIGPGLIALAVALNILAVAVKIFATMSWEELGKGILGVGGALTALGLGLTFMGPSVLLVGPGLIAVALAMNLLSGAVRSFGTMNLLDLGKGILGIAAALVAIGLAILFIPPTVGLQAAGLVVLAVALTGIAGAIGILGAMDILSMVKGIAALGAILVVLGVGLTAMAGTLPGSVALLAAAAALAVLAPTLAFLGTLKWSTIIKGLVAIALTLGTLAVVGALAAAPLSALGIALLPLAGVMVLAATATLIFAKGLSLLGSNGAKGLAVMVTAITAFLAILPKLVIGFIKGLVDIAAEAAKVAPEVVAALGVIIGSALAIVTDAAPKMAVAMSAVIQALLKILVDNSPKIVAAGFQLLTDLLSGIASNIGLVTAQVAAIVVNFLNALSASAPQLTTAGVVTLGAFLLGITKNMPKLVEAVVKLITGFVNAIASRVGRIVEAASNLMVKFIAAVSGYYTKLITAGTNLILNFLEGVGNAIPRLVKGGLNVAKKFLNGIADGLAGLADIGFKAIIRFLNGLEKAIRENTDELFDAGAGVADAIIDGLVDQFGKLGGVLRKALEKVFGLLPGWAKKILGINSPSKVFMEIGKFTMLGMAKGITENGKLVKDSGVGVGNAVIDSFRDTFGIHSPSEVMREIGKFVGEGFAKGLEGSQSDIRGAFTSLNEKLNDSIRTAKETIKSEQDKIDDLLKEKKPDWEAIREAQKVIDQNEAVLKRSRAAHTALTEALRDEKHELLGLAKDYEDVSKKLEEAQAALDEAKKTRDDAQKSLTDKFNTTPTIDKDSKTMVQDYVTALKEQIKATASYSETLAKLRALGLDDKTYQKLLDEGLAGKDFAESLLKGGQTAVDGINKLDAELLAASTTLAQNAATTLYQAGVDAAQGLVNGLTSKKIELQFFMENLADTLVSAIKKKLKIKSPSQTFRQIGSYVMEGLSAGLSDGSKDATNTMGTVAKDVVDAATSGLGVLQHRSWLGSVVDIEPVITPVLDLSSVEKSAKGLADLTNVTPITAAASFGMASVVSEEQKASQTAQADQAAEASKTFNFEQNNYSPESLSDVEIYRQTNNQLSQLKSIIGMVP